VSYNGEEIVVGAVFWFIVSIFLIFLGWFIVRKIWSRHFTEKHTKVDEERVLA
jgi:hypothetical protein